MRKKGVRVTVKSLSLKREALRLHKCNGSQSFKASRGWFRNFKRRHNLSFRRTTHIRQKDKAVADDRVDQFLKFVIRMRSKRDYSLHEIGNMDETTVWLEMPAKSTLEPTG